MKDQLDLSTMESVAVDRDGFLRIRRYWKPPSESFWDDIWRNTPSRHYWSRALRGQGLGDFGPLYMRYLAPGASILEAGCGLGHVVLAFRALGFNAQGLDFATKTITLLNAAFPEVPIQHGDVRDLPYRSGIFDAYVSLGVIEHFEAGQEGILSEAARVLRPGGVLFLSVPAVNGYRRWRAGRGGYAGRPTTEFFEDCYSAEELRALVTAAGFSPLELSFGNPVMTFAQETWVRPLYWHLEGTRLPRSAVDRVLRRLLPRRWFGHMMMIVARKHASD
jgi:SAM-dependent methyltransferase